MMKTREQDILAVKALGHQQQCCVAWSVGGGGEVHRIWDTLFLFSIPLYGGEGHFEGPYELDEIECLVYRGRHVS